MVEGSLHRRLAENLRRYRQSKGLSQEALSLEIGLHRTYIGGIEQGRRNPTLQTVERFADLLGIDDPLELLRD